MLQEQGDKRVTDTPMTDDEFFLYYDHWSDADEEVEDQGFWLQKILNELQKKHKDLKYTLYFGFSLGAKVLWSQRRSFRRGGMKSWDEVRKFAELISEELKRTVKF